MPPVNQGIAQFGTKDAALNEAAPQRPGFGKLIAPENLSKLCTPLKIEKLTTADLASVVAARKEFGGTSVQAQVGFVGLLLTPKVQTSEEKSAGVSAVEIYVAAKGDLETLTEKQIQLVLNRFNKNQAVIKENLPEEEGLHIDAIIVQLQEKLAASKAKAAAVDSHSTRADHLLVEGVVKNKLKIGASPPAQVKDAISSITAAVENELSKEEASWSLWTWLSAKSSSTEARVSAIITKLKGTKPKLFFHLSTSFLGGSPVVGGVSQESSTDPATVSQQAVRTSHENAMGLSPAFQESLGPVEDPHRVRRNVDECAVSVNPSCSGYVFVAGDGLPYSITDNNLPAIISGLSPSETAIIESYLSSCGEGVTYSDLTNVAQSGPQINKLRRDVISLVYVDSDTLESCGLVPKLIDAAELAPLVTPSDNELRCSSIGQFNSENRFGVTQLTQAFATSLESGFDFLNDYFVAGDVPSAQQSDVAASRLHSLFRALFAPTTGDFEVSRQALVSHLTAGNATLISTDPLVVLDQIKIFEQGQVNDAVSQILANGPTGTINVPLFSNVIIKSLASGEGTDDCINSPFQALAWNPVTNQCIVPTSPDCSGTQPVSDTVVLRDAGGNVRVVSISSAVDAVCASNSAAEKIAIMQQMFHDINGQCASPVDPTSSSSTTPPPSSAPSSSTPAVSTTSQFVVPGECIDTVNAVKDALVTLNGELEMCDDAGQIGDLGAQVVWNEMTSAQQDAFLKGFTESGFDFTPYPDLVDDSFITRLQDAAAAGPSSTLQLNYPSADFKALISVLDRAGCLSSANQALTNIIFNCEVCGTDTASIFSDLNTNVLNNALPLSGNRYVNVGAALTKLQLQQLFCTASQFGYTLPPELAGFTNRDTNVTTISVSDAQIENVLKYLQNGGQPLTDGSNTFNFQASYPELNTYLNHVEEPSSNRGGLSDILIGVISAVGVVALAALCILGVCIKRRRNEARKPTVTPFGQVLNNIYKNTSKLARTRYFDGVEHKPLNRHLIIGSAIGDAESSEIIFRGKFNETDSGVLMVRPFSQKPTKTINLELETNMKRSADLPGVTKGQLIQYAAIKMRHLKGRHESYFQYEVKSRADLKADYVHSETHDHTFTCAGKPVNDSDVLYVKIPFVDSNGEFPDDRYEVVALTIEDIYNILKPDQERSEEADTDVLLPFQDRFVSGYTLPVEIGDEQRLHDKLIGQFSPFISRVNDDRQVEFVLGPKSDRLNNSAFRVNMIKAFLLEGDTIDNYSVRPYSVETREQARINETDVSFQDIYDYLIAKARLVSGNPIPKEIYDILNKETLTTLLWPVVIDGVPVGITREEVCLIAKNKKAGKAVSDIFNATDEDAEFGFLGQELDPTQLRDFRNTLRRGPAGGDVGEYLSIQEESQLPSAFHFSHVLTGMPSSVGGSTVLSHNRTYMMVAYFKEMEAQIDLYLTQHSSGDTVDMEGARLLVDRINTAYPNIQTELLDVPQYEKLIRFLNIITFDATPRSSSSAIDETSFDGEITGVYEEIRINQAELDTLKQSLESDLEIVQMGGYVCLIEFAETKIRGIEDTSEKDTFLLKLLSAFQKLIQEPNHDETITQEQYDSLMALFNGSVVKNHSIFKTLVPSFKTLKKTPKFDMDKVRGATSILEIFSVSRQPLHDVATDGSIYSGIEPKNAAEAYSCFERMALLAQGKHIQFDSDDSLNCIPFIEAAYRLLSKEDKAKYRLLYNQFIQRNVNSVMGQLPSVFTPVRGHHTAPSAPTTPKALVELGQILARKNATSVLTFAAQDPKLNNNTVDQTGNIVSTPVDSAKIYLDRLYNLSQDRAFQKLKRNEDVIKTFEKLKRLGNEDEYSDLESKLFEDEITGFFKGFGSQCRSVCDLFSFGIKNKTSLSDATKLSEFFGNLSMQADIGQTASMPFAKHNTRENIEFFEHFFGQLPHTKAQEFTYLKETLFFDLSRKLQKAQTFQDVFALLDLYYDTRTSAFHERFTLQNIELVLEKLNSADLRYTKLTTDNRTKFDALIARYNRLKPTNTENSYAMLERKLFPTVPATVDALVKVLGESPAPSPELEAGDTEPLLHSRRADKLMTLFTFTLSKRGKEKETISSADKSKILEVLNADQSAFPEDQNRKHYREQVAKYFDVQLTTPSTRVAFKRRVSEAKEPTLFSNTEDGNLEQYLETEFSKTGYQYGGIVAKQNALRIIREQKETITFSEAMRILEDEEAIVKK